MNRNLSAPKATLPRIRANQSQGVASNATLAYRRETTRRADLAKNLMETREQENKCYMAVLGYN